MKNITKDILKGVIHVTNTLPYLKTIYTTQKYDSRKNYRVNEPLKLIVEKCTVYGSLLKGTTHDLRSPIHDYFFVYKVLRVLYTIQFLKRDFFVYITFKIVSTTFKSLYTLKY